MTNHKIVELRRGPLALSLAPSFGGSILRFDWVDGDAKVPILRPTEGASPTILDTANFPLVPFVNRVRGGSFAFRGREVRLAANLPGDVSPLHGQGWLGAWAVEEQSESQVRLSFAHEAGEWPWAYAAEQVLRLEDDGLAMRISCRNLSDEPMPCGLGHHPYFPCTAQTVVDTGVTHVWTIDENVLPVEKVAAEGRYGLRQRAICGQGLDHGFGGWNGRVEIRTPGLAFEAAVTSPDARFFQIYSPAEGGFFVAEPVSHANTAMNAPEEEWAELGFRVLEPGEEMALDARIEVTPRGG